MQVWVPSGEGVARSPFDGLGALNKSKGDGVCRLLPKTCPLTEWARLSTFEPWQPFNFAPASTAT